MALLNETKHPPRGANRKRKPIAEPHNTSIHWCTDYRVRRPTYASFRREVGMAYEADRRFGQISCQLGNPLPPSSNRIAFRLGLSSIIQFQGGELGSHMSLWGV